MFATIFAVLFSLLAPLRFGPAEHAAVGAEEPAPPPPSAPGEDAAGAGKAQRPLRDGLYVGF
ncbi:MAG: hypothetical protein JNM72_15920 [Deltaproteobacteria bacterium]|jgi:hypothetical protein|nr:hypothetical protein [Deltaproteobacteria bacterium]